jgi:hypothetical protein
LDRHCTDIDSKIRKAGGDDEVDEHFWARQAAEQAAAAGDVDDYSELT